MNLQRENYNLNKYNTLIRMVSVILVVVFLWQNLVWANPDIGSPSIAPAKDNIQVQTIFSNPANRDISVADLIQRAVESSVPDREKLTISDIDRTLSILDKWDEKYLGIFEWETALDAIGIASELIITIKDDSGQPQVELRYYDQHSDTQSNKIFPAAWEDSEAHIVNAHICKQVKEFSENGKPKDIPSAITEEFTKWGEEEIAIVSQILEFSGESITDKLGEKFVLKIEPNKTGRYPILINILRKTDRISVGSVELNIVNNAYSGLTLDLGFVRVYSDVAGVNYRSRGILKSVLKMVTEVMPNDSQLHIDRLEETDTLKALTGGNSWVKTKIGTILFQSGWKPEVISICEDSTTTHVLYDRRGTWKQFQDKDAFRLTLAEAIKDIDETDQIEGAIVRVELSRIKRNRKTVSEKKTKQFEEEASPREEDNVYSRESINKDRYEIILEHIMNIFVLMARRKQAKEDVGDLFAAPLKAASRREALKTGFEKVVELIENDNEPAASAFLVGKLNSIAKEKEDILRKKISLRTRRVKVWRADGMVLMKHHVYVKQHETSRSAVPQEGEIKFNLRWQAGRSLDEQEDGILDEREWILGYLKKLENFQKDVDNIADISYLEEVVDELLEGMARVDVEEKRLARKALETIKKLIDIAHRDYIKHILPIAIRYLRLRVENLDSMLSYLKSGRVEPFRNIVNGDNEDLIARADRVSDLIKEGDYKRALGNAYGLWKKVKRYLREPDMEDLRSLVWPLIFSLREINGHTDDAEWILDARREDLLEKAKFWQSLIKSKLTTSKELSLFMEFFRTVYVEKRLDGAEGDIKKVVFIDTFNSFVSKKQLVRGSPEVNAFRILAYMVAFVPMEIKNPDKLSEKLPNPKFKAFNTLRLIVEINNIEKILAIKRLEGLRETHKALNRARSRDEINNLTKGEKTILLRSLAADFGVEDVETFIEETFDINKQSGNDGYRGIKGNAAEPQKMEVAALIALLSASLFLVMSQFYLSPLIYLVSVVYVINMGAWPMLTAYFIRDGLSFRQERKDHGLITPFENAENVRYIQDHEEEAKGKISYYSYVIENKLDTGEEKEIKSALFVDKSAMRRIPKIMQYVIYLHEMIHFKFRVKIEAAAVPLTYCLPWTVGGSLALIIFGSSLMRPDLIFLLGFTMYNAFIPILSGWVAVLFGVTRSRGGHMLIDSKKHKHLKDSEIDSIIVRHVHAITYDKVRGTSIYWRDWLRGEDSYKNFAIIKCPNRPEDIIVIKSKFDASNEILLLNLKVKLESSGKRSFVLIMADDGPESVLSKEERRLRIETITRNISRMVKMVRPGGKLVKKDVRSTQYDITRLRDLLQLYRRRLIRIKHHNMEREAVVSEVHGYIKKLKVVLEWLKKNGYRHSIFMGDYLGKTKNGFEALDVLKDYVNSKEYSGITLLMGRSEHIFLRAMFGDDRFTDSWPNNEINEGAQIIKSLRGLAAKKIDHNMSAQMQHDIKKAKEFEELIENIAKKTGSTTQEARGKWYRLHPKLIDMVEFIVNNMRFVYHEDKHHNIYLIGSIPEDFKWKGLRGVEVLRAMEEEFCEGANIGLRQLKLMRAAWVLMNASADEDKANRVENVEKVMTLINTERKINRTLGRELISNDILNEIESVIIGEKLGEHLDKVFDDIARKMSESTRPLPHIFDMVFPHGLDEMKRSPFMPGGKGGMNIQQENDEARQKRRVELGVNTVITPDNFPSGKGFQSLQWVRAFDKEGNLNLINVNFLLDGNFEAGQILAGQSDGKKASLENVTRRKLEAVEDIVNNYDSLTVNIREKRLWETIKKVIMSPFFFLTVVAMIVTFYGIKSGYDLDIGLLSLSASLGLFTGSEESGDEDQEEDEVSPYAQDDPDEDLEGIEDLDEAEDSPDEITSDIGEEIEKLEDTLNVCRNIEQALDVEARRLEMLKYVRAILEKWGNTVSIEDPEIYGILFNSEQDLIVLKKKVDETIERNKWHPKKGIASVYKGAEETAKKLKSGEKGEKFLNGVSTKLEALSRFGEYIKENHPEMYKRNLKRMEEARKTLEGVIASLKGSKEGSSSTINALMIASVAGLLVTVYAPIVAKYLNGYDLTLRDMLFVYIGFIVGVMTVSMLKGFDWFKARREIISEKRKPIEGIKRVLILDDRQEYIDQIKKTYSHAQIIKQAKTLEEAQRLIEDNPPFDLVISDLCLVENPIVSIFKKVQINGKKVALRKGGQEFVLWLKNNKKAPEHIILHSTMFNLASFDAFFSFLTGYNPVKTRKIVEKAGIIVQPKSWTLSSHHHSRKTILLWMGIIGTLFLFDMSVISKYLDSYVSVLAAPIFSAIVTGLGIKAIIAGRRKEKPDDVNNEAKEEQKGESIEVKTPVEKKEKAKNSPAPRAPKKDIMAEALPLLEELSQGETNDIGKIENLGYYTTLFYKGEKPAAKDPLFEIGKLAESLEFTLKEISEFKDFTIELIGQFAHAIGNELEVFMFRKIEENGKKGVLIVVRKYEEDTNDIELCNKYGFTNVTIESSGKKTVYDKTGLVEETRSNITKGTRIIIKRFEEAPPVMLPSVDEMVTDDDIAKHIKQLERDNISYVTIYNENGSEAYKMPFEEFKGKAPGRVGIIPKRGDNDLKWVEFLGSGGLASRPDHLIEVVAVDETGRFYLSSQKKRYVLGRGYSGEDVKIVHDSEGNFKVIHKDYNVAFYNAAKDMFMVTAVKFGEKCVINYLGKRFEVSTMFAGEEVKIIPYEDSSSDFWMKGFRVIHQGEEIAFYDASEDRFIELITKLDAQGRFDHQGIKFTVGRSYAGEIIRIYQYRGEGWEKGCSVVRDIDMLGDCDLKTGEFHPDRAILRSTDEKGRFGFRGLRLSLESKFANQNIGVDVIEEDGVEKGFKVYWLDEEVGYYNFADETFELTLFGKKGPRGYVSQQEILSIDEEAQEDLSPEEGLLYEQGIYADEDLIKEIRKEVEDIEETIGELEREKDPKEVLSVIFQSLQPDLEDLIEECSEENSYGLSRFFHLKLEEIQEKIDELVRSAKEKIYPQLDSADELIKNAEKIVPLLERALRAWAGSVEDREEVVFFLDMPAEQSERVKIFIEEMVIKPLQRGSGDNVKTSDILRNVRILARGKDNEGVRKLKMRVQGDSPRWKPENVVILTSKSNLKDFSDIKGSFVTALDFSLLEVPEGFDLDEYYYPYVEAALFALIRAIGAFDLKNERPLEEYKERMWQWYKQIPNIEKLTRVQFTELVFNSDNSPKEVVMLKLIVPDAVKFDPQDVYEMVKEFITRA